MTASVLITTDMDKVITTGMGKVITAGIFPHAPDLFKRMAVTAIQELIVGMEMARTAMDQLTAMSSTPTMDTKMVIIMTHMEILGETEPACKFMVRLDSVSMVVSTTGDQTHLVERR